MGFFWVGPGSGTGAHFCVPAGQRQELQTPVEVRRGEPRLLPPAPAHRWKEQPQRLHATRVPLQIQVETEPGRNREVLSAAGGGCGTSAQVALGSTIAAYRE